MRRTPSAASWSTVVKSVPTTTFTGFGATARTTVAMSDGLLIPGRTGSRQPASA
jgi:hypothetical protein